jgi:hypothetical protein
MHALLLVSRAVACPFGSAVHTHYDVHFCFVQDEFDRLLQRHTHPYNCQRQLSRACPDEQAAAAALARQTAMQHQPSSAYGTEANNNCDHWCATGGSFKAGAAACSCQRSPSAGPCTELSPDLWLELSQVCSIKAEKLGKDSKDTFLSLLSNCNCMKPCS